MDTKWTDKFLVAAISSYCFDVDILQLPRSISRIGGGGEKFLNRNITSPPRVCVYNDNVVIPYHKSRR